MESLLNRQKPEADYLAESLEELQKALEHFQYSSDACREISDHPKLLSEEELVQLEAFTSRFSRVVDLMSKRCLRALDQFEMMEPGTLLDVANRAEKRGLIDSVDWLREVKDVRNEISHDYAGERLLEVLSYCRSEFARIAETCDRIIKYGNKLLHP